MTGGRGLEHPVLAAAHEEQSSGALARRLGGVTEPEERERVVLELVREQAAAILGHASADDIDPERPFKDLGFDSLGAVELRNRLVRVSGGPLPTTLIFDHPTPADVARLLLEKVRDGGEASAADEVGSGFGGEGAPDSTLSGLLRRAYRTGGMERAMPWLLEASVFRPSFTSSAELKDEGGHLVRLAEGAGLPKLVCVPSFVVGSGPHQFMALADHFAGKRDVFVCSLPGFRGGEPAPASWEAAVEVLAESVRRTVGDEPFVLVGYSIGGVIAHALAARFEETGSAPEGVVMLDTPSPEGSADELNRVFSLGMSALLEDDQRAAAVDDDGWLAMGTYVRLLGQRRPARIGTRSLAVRATVPLDGDGALRDWPDWDVCDTHIDIAADHFSLVKAMETADAIEGWIA
ncbi:alpha/beta fold hydrolase [Streptomyces sp. JJ38]|nr:alpha/beta fold hydrolase [Streptomyces sp. JJ38]